MKKFIASFLAFLLIVLNTAPALAACSRCTPEQVLCTEHLCINKKAPNNTVTITNYRKIICKGNVLAINYECRFCSKKACTGDVVNFVLPQSLYTEEGTMIIPACSKIVAEIIKVQQPKWFNKNARVTMVFRCIILPDGRVIPTCARAFTKDGTFKEGPWMTTGKIVLSTVTLGIIGTGAGVGFGFIPSPTQIGVGIAAGVSTGAGIGLLAALVTKGLQYKAKAGEQVYIILNADTSICN